MEKIKCPRCGATNPESSSLCTVCGSSLERERGGKIGVVIGRLKENPLFAQILPPLGGFLITLLFFIFIAVAFNPAGYIYRLFLTVGDPYQRIIPFLTVFLCVWSLLLLIFLKLMPILEERKGLNDETIASLPQLIRDEDVKSVLDKVKANARVAHGTLYRRVRSLLEELESSGDVQRGHELFRHQSEIDSDTIATGYSSIRLFIWAMPILGFLGTVIGISLAVGNFSSFLGGNIEDIDMVKRELSRVSTGLSYAFDTTLLGLSTALITMIVQSFVQRREEGFLTDLDVLCLKTVSNFQTETPSAAVLARIPFDVLKKSTESFKEEIKLMAGELSQSIKSFSDNYGASLEHLFKLTGDMGDVSGKLLRDGKDVGALVGDLKNFSQVLANVIDSNNKHLMEFYTSFSAHVEPLHSTLHANKQTLDALHAFNPVLTDIRGVLDRLIPLMNNLNGPFEFRVVPSQEVMNPQRSSNPNPPGPTGDK